MSKRRKCPRQECRVQRRGTDGVENMLLHQMVHKAVLERSPEEGKVWSGEDPQGRALQQGAGAEARAAVWERRA